MIRKAGEYSKVIGAIRGKNTEGYKQKGHMWKLVLDCHPDTKHIYFTKKNKPPKKVLCKACHMIRNIITRTSN